MTPDEWPVKPVEPLAWLNARLETGRPGCYLRFNDGEGYSMSAMKVAPESNGEHVYSAQVRSDLLATYAAALAASATTDDVLVGSWWYEDPTHPAAEWLRSTAEAWGLQGARWSRGHVWHREEGGCPNKELLRLVRNLRECDTVVYGPTFLRPVAKGLGAMLCAVPERDASGSPPFTVPDNRVSVYCCGFPAKTWAWKDYTGSRETKTDKVVIDAGSLFDGLCGRVSREWLRPNSGPHADFYYGAFRKAVLG